MYVEIEVKYKQFDFILTGDYTPYDPPTLEYPGTQEGFEPDKLLIGEERINIIDIIDERELDKIIDWAFDKERTFSP